MDINQSIIEKLACNLTEEELDHIASYWDEFVIHRSAIEAWELKTGKDYYNDQGDMQWNQEN